MKNDQNPRTRRYAKISIFPFFFAVATLLWLLFSLASGNAQKFTEPDHISIIMESLPDTAHLNYSNIPTTNDHFEKIVSMYYVLFFLDVRSQVGVPNLEGRRNVVKQALIHYIRKAEPTFPTSSFDRTVHHEIYPMIFEMIFADTKVVDWLFARSILAEYQLKDLAPEQVYYKFRVPSGQESYEALQLLIKEGGYDEGSMLQYVQIYKAKHEFRYSN